MIIIPEIRLDITRKYEWLEMLSYHMYVFWLCFDWKKSVEYIRLRIELESAGTFKNVVSNFLISKSPTYLEPF